MDVQPTEKRMRLRYAGVCDVCGAGLAPKAEAIYDRTLKAVRCVTHEVAPGAPEGDVIEAGTPGSSARREFERRNARREERIRAKHPRLAGLVLAVTDDPQTTKAWDTGALGEERLGARPNEFASDTFRVLHDRRIPGTRENIDHLAVTSTGVYVLDAKRYRGRPQQKSEGGLLRPRVEKLLVGTRDCTKLVDGVLKQVDIVRDLLDDDDPVQGDLCFIDADWPVVGGAFATRGVRVLWPNKLYRTLQVIGALGTQLQVEAHRTLADGLPAA